MTDERGASAMGRLNPTRVAANTMTALTRDWLILIIILPATLTAANLGLREVTLPPDPSGIRIVETLVTLLARSVQIGVVAGLAAATVLRPRGDLRQRMQGAIAAMARSILPLLLFGLLMAAPDTAYNLYAGIMLGEGGRSTNDLGFAIAMAAPFSLAASLFLSCALVAMPSVAVAEQPSAPEALRRAYGLGRGSWLAIFGLRLLFGLPYVAVAILGVTAAQFAPNPDDLPLKVVGMLLSAFLLVVWFVVGATIYRSLVAGADDD